MHHGQQQSVQGDKSIGQQIDGDVALKNSLRRDESFLVRVHVADCNFTGSLPRSSSSSGNYSADSSLQMDTRSSFPRAAE